MTTERLDPTAANNNGSAFAGLSERREHAGDDFWSWRDRMYGVALRITPAQLRAVAAQLYVELLRENMALKVGYPWKPNQWQKSCSGYPLPPMKLITACSSPAYISASIWMLTGNLPKQKVSKFCK